MKRILIVEDNQSDTWVIRTAIQEAGIEAELQIITDGERAIEYIVGDGDSRSYPNLQLLILDLNLPRHSGHEVMKRWRESSLHQVPIIVVSSSNSPHDLAFINRYTPYYFRKPFDLDEFLKIGDLIADVLDGRSSGVAVKAGSDGL